LLLALSRSSDPLRITKIFTQIISPHGSFAGFP
jgi:hypothetical protein